MQFSILNAQKSAYIGIWKIFFYFLLLLFELAVFVIADGFSPVYITKKKSTAEATEAQAKQKLLQQKQ